MKCKCVYQGRYKDSINNNIYNNNNIINNHHS